MSEAAIVPPASIGPTGSLDAMLGDPFAAGAVRFADIAVDENASRVTPEVRAVCEAWGVGAALAPQEWGGTRSSTADLVSRLRPVFRRDLSLGAELVLAPLAAMNAVLAAGDAGQRSELAGRIIAGERIGAALAEPEAPVSSRGFRTRSIDGGWLADGETPLVAGADASSLWLVPARGAGDADAVALLDPGDVGVDVAPWVETVGLRGTRFGLATVRSVLPTVGVLESGDGVGLRRARAETIATAGALMIAGLDTAVRLAMPYASGRRLYRGTVLEIPHVQSLLADVHTDLLLADALTARVVADIDADALDPVTASASAYLVPQLLADAMRSLSVLFGSTFYARVEPYAVFETFVRDIGSMSLIGLTTRHALEPCEAALDSWSRDTRRAEDELAVSPPFAESVRSRDREDSVAARRLARQASILAAAEVSADVRDADPTHGENMWFAAASQRLRARLTGRKDTLPEDCIQSAIHDLTRCVDAGLSLTRERLPVFGR